MPIDPTVVTAPTPNPQPGTAPAVQATESAQLPVQPDRFEASSGTDPVNMLRALEQHVEGWASVATATMGRGLQAAKGAPKIVDGASARMAGLAGVVLSMPGDVPHDAAHGYGVSAGHSASGTVLQTRRDARTLARAMPVGVTVKTVTCRKPPKPEYEATRSAFNGTLKMGSRTVLERSSSNTLPKRNPRSFARSVFRLARMERTPDTSGCG